VNCEIYLNRWITNYVELSDRASDYHKATRPLRDARIDVIERPGKPGVYRASVYLRPHFQMDDLGVDLRMAVDLPLSAFNLLEPVMPRKTV